MTANPDTPAVYTAEEAAGILRVKPRWLKRQAAARKVPFTMLAGSYRFSAQHLTEILQMNEKVPQSTGSSGNSRRRGHRHHSGSVADSSDAPLRSRPTRRRLARDLGSAP